MDNKIEIYEKRLFELIDNLKREIANKDMKYTITFREILNVVCYLSFTEKYTSNNDTFIWIKE